MDFSGFLRAPQGSLGFLFGFLGVPQGPRELSGVLGVLLNSFRFWGAPWSLGLCGVLLDSLRIHPDSSGFPMPRGVFRSLQVFSGSQRTPQDSSGPFGGLRELLGVLRTLWVIQEPGGFLGTLLQLLMAPLDVVRGSISSQEIF